MKLLLQYRGWGGQGTVILQQFISDTIKRFLAIVTTVSTCTQVFTNAKFGSHRVFGICQTLLKCNNSIINQKQNVELVFHGVTLTLVELVFHGVSLTLESMRS